MSDLPSTQPQPPSRRSRVRKIIVIVIGLAIFGLAADAIRWLYPSWKKSRADTFASQAHDAFEATNFTVAEANILDALRVAPNDPRFLRLAARIYGAQKKGNAIAYFEALLNTKDAVERDRLDFIELSLILKRPEIAEPLVNRMLVENPGQVQTLYYVSLWNEARGKTNEAIKFAREATQLKDAGGETRLLLSRLLIDSREPDKVAEGKKILFEMASSSFRDRASAVQILASMNLSQRELLQLARWLRENPTPRSEDYLLASELLWRANTNSLPKLAEEAVAKLKSGRPLQRATLGYWLNRHGLYEMTLTNIPPDFRSPTMTAVHLDALVGARQWTNALNLGEAAERAGARDLAAAIYGRLSTNSPVSAQAAAALSRLNPQGAATRSSQ